MCVVGRGGGVIANCFWKVAKIIYDDQLLTRRTENVQGICTQKHVCGIAFFVTFPELAQSSKRCNKPKITGEQKLAICFVVLRLFHTPAAKF